ncbi:MAG: hypothetical protein QCH99_08250 [Candidatus Bathyarchaeota archaeon]|nr:hypothetical protein [Candidatus Bathyarchaeum tardum]
MSLKNVLSRLPNSLKTFLKYSYSTVPCSVRLGKAFWQTYLFLQISQWWTREQLENYQMEQLRGLLQHTYDNVPYYRKIFDVNKFKPKDIHTLDDLKTLPTLDKNTFKNSFKELIARNISDYGHLQNSHTSGTSGKPLHFYLGFSETEREWAFVCHQWSRVGYKPGDPRVELRGPVSSGAGQVIHDPINNVLRLSPRIDDVKIAQYYLKRMKLFNSPFLHGYPSAIATFAHIIRKHNLEIPFKLKAVLFTSEVVYDWERETVQEVFGCRVFSHYGMSEHVATAAECERSNYYHFVPQYGITEIDPKTHEIIATSFLNYANPFIRYRTTDIAQSVLSKCKYCVRHYFPIIKKIQGRLEDYIITPSGTLIPPAIITHPFKELKNIKDTQLIQESVNQLVLCVVLWDKPVSKASKAELKQLSKDLQEILGVDMQIKTEIMDEIELLKSGKFKWIISNVSKGLIEKGLEIN